MLALKRSVIPPGCRELPLRLTHQYGRAAFERTGDLENDGQRGHVFAALYFSHVGALDAGAVSQRFLGYALLRTHGTHRCAEGLGQFGVEGGGTGGAAGSDGSLLHGQKRPVEGQLKPRYL